MTHALIRKYANADKVDQQCVVTAITGLLALALIVGGVEAADHGVMGFVLGSLAALCLIAAAAMVAAALYMLTAKTLGLLVRTLVDQ